MRRPFTLLVFAMFAVTLLSLGAAGWALNEREDQAQARRVQQQSFNERVRQVSLDYCREIEKLKAARREEAVRGFRDLSKNLRLLGITETPQLVAAARDSRNRTLVRFRREPCPRPAQQAP